MNDPIKTHFSSLREFLSSLNIKTKKREQVLEIVNSLEAAVNSKIRPQPIAELKNGLSETNITGLASEKNKKKKRRLFKYKTDSDGEKSSKSSLLGLASTRTPKRPDLNLISQREDSIQNLHLFLENRAAKLALERHEKSSFYIPNSALETLQRKLMKMPVQLCKANSTPLACLFGPDDYESEDRYGEVASAQTISTYPTIPDFGRSGDPICDRFYVQLYENTSIIALGDGCNWGDKPREAAILACNEIVSFMSSRLSKYVDTSDIGCLLLKAFMRAHDKILATKEVCYEAGTTTVLAGLLVKLAEPVDSKEWVFVCVSVGDCKGFYYSKSKKTFIEITVGNRMNLTDARDCGGRLGPADAEGLNPDLRNLMTYYALLDEEDIVVVVSDGVHDNFDPQLRGLEPREFGIDAEDWNEAEEKFVEQTNSIKSKFLIDTMNEAVHNANEPITPHLITKTLIALSKEVTEPCRSFMEETLGARQPEDYKKYPGKMDHTSCVSIRAQLNSIHPFQDLSSVLQTERGACEFRKFIDREAETFLFSGRDDLPDGEKKVVVQKEIEFLQELYKLCLPSDSPACEYIHRVFDLYDRSVNDDGYLLDKTLEDSFVKSCKQFIDDSIITLERRLNAMFDGFRHTKWMKYECFSPDALELEEQKLEEFAELED